jgi:hypothetical protein
MCAFRIGCGVRGYFVMICRVAIKRDCMMVRGVCVSGMGGCGIMCYFGNLLVHRTGFFRISLFSAENIPFKTG